jgi:RNA polymerase sigma-70 factor (ECF subfamily)
MTPVEQAVAQVSPELKHLTAGLARGDDAAWAQFHRDYGPAIFRQLLGATRGDHDLASEALQQTYLRIARHARPCDSEVMFGAWLRVVARTALSDCRRRRRSFWDMLRRRANEPEEPDRDAGAHEEDNFLTGAIDAALAALAPEERALLEAKYYDGESVHVIAERLGISIKAAESRLTRARTELRQQLSDRIARHE